MTQKPCWYEGYGGGYRCNMLALPDNIDASLPIVDLGSGYAGRRHYSEILESDNNGIIAVDPNHSKDISALPEGMHSITDIHNGDVTKVRNDMLTFLERIHPNQLVNIHTSFTDGFIMRRPFCNNPDAYYEYMNAIGKEIERVLATGQYFFQNNSVVGEFLPSEKFKWHSEGNLSVFQKK